MTVVGFDVAKKSLVGAILGNDGLVICCESTGYSHYPLLRAAAALKLSCRVLNPILTKQAMKATVRGKKTDRSDAVLIARLGLRGEGQPPKETKRMTHTYRSNDAGLSKAACQGACSVAAGRRICEDRLLTNTTL